MSNVLPLPVPHPKLVEANARAQALATLRKDQEQYIKDAVAVGDYKFVIIQPDKDYQGMTVCYKQTGFNTCAVSTALLNPHDKVVPVVGKFESLNRMLNGNCITLKKPSNVPFDLYLNVVFAFASAR